MLEKEDSKQISLEAEQKLWLEREQLEREIRERVRLQKELDKLEKLKKVFELKNLSSKGAINQEENGFFQPPVY